MHRTRRTCLESSLRSTNRHDASLQRFAQRRTSARQALDETFSRNIRGGAATTVTTTRSSIYSAPAAVVDQSALDRSRATFDVRQSMRQEEMRNTQLRMSAAEAHIGAARIPDHMGSATGAVKEIIELEQILEKRIQVRFVFVGLIAACPLSRWGGK